jgi:hypothetical protein
MDHSEIAAAAQEFETARARGEYFPERGLTGSPSTMPPASCWH